MKKSLSDTSFSNPFTDSLPGDESFDPTPRETPDVCYSLVKPTPVAKITLVAWSEELADQLGLTSPLEDDLLILGGNKIPRHAKPYSLCYGGHQFGHWAGQLGDGRAITYGSIGDQNRRSWELQLKGAGPTPYSRFADGRAVLRSSLREFLASEAMFHLHVPTTRALSLVTTGERVFRDMFYSGDLRPEPGAVVSRLAPCFLRFGNFEILAAQGNTDLLRQLFDWMIQQHFPHLKELEEKQKILQWFREISEKTAFLVTEWLRVGFVHGVLNTDNMSALGLTIDYGPYGWLEEYDPSWTPNTTDLPGRRYCFGRQASIAHWNLERLSKALNTIRDDVEEGLKDGLTHYVKSFELHFINMMNNKLGLQELHFSKDEMFLRELDEALQGIHIDMTLFYRTLGSWDPQRDDKNIFLEKIYRLCYLEPADEPRKKFEDWFDLYSERLRKENQEHHSRQKRMNRFNPKYILRNYMAFEIQQELEKKQTDHLLKEIFALLKNPYEEQPSLSKWAQLRPDWAKEQPGSSTLSCSS